MSDKRHSERDTSRSASAKMSLVLDHDEAALNESCKWLEHLTLSEFRGRGDTVGAARGRIARKIGLRPSYANRLWNRAAEMTGVAGGAYRALKLAYEEQCQRIEDHGDRYRSLREGLRHEALEGDRTDPVALPDVEARRPDAAPSPPRGSATGR